VLLIRTFNPDPLSGPSVLVVKPCQASLHICRAFYRYREMSGVLRGGLFCIFQKGVSMRPSSKSFPSYHPNYLWVFIFESREKRFFKVWSCLIKIFFSASYNVWKGVYQTIHQKFSKLSSKLFMGFYFWKSREKVFYVKRGGFERVLSSILLCNCIFTW